MPPSSIATLIATTGSMPGPRPTKAVAKFTSRCATPERSKMTPTRMNIGKASSGYFARLGKKLFGIDIMPRSAKPMPMAPPSSSATPMGTPISIRMPKTRKMLNAIMPAAAL